MKQFSSDQTFDLIERIAALPGKNEKTELVKFGMEHPGFTKVLVAAYSPLLTYGMQDVPGKQFEFGSRAFDSTTWSLLDSLERRVLTGDAARIAVKVEMDQLDDKSAELLKRIIKKDLRAGFGESTINKAVPGTLPEYPYMRCSLPAKSNMPKWDWSAGIISQEKADGMFANVNVDAQGALSITTRQGTPIPLDKIVRLVDVLTSVLYPETQTHGEIIVLQDQQVLPREKGNGIMNSIAQGGGLEPGQELVYQAWDQIPLECVKPKGQCKTPYYERLRILEAQARGLELRLFVVIPTRVVKSKAEAYAHYRELLKLGKEGTVCKHPYGFWKDATSSDCVKLKLTAPCELQVVGYVPGNGKNESTFGALQCQSSCGELRVDVSGMTDAMRKKLFECPKTLGSIITVNSNAIMTPSKSSDVHSLFLPRFVEQRLDKSTADSLQRIRDQFDAAMEAA